MSDNTANKRRSKRNRSLVFDLSRTSVQSPKKKKSTKGESNSKMQNPNVNVDPGFRDMSNTINNPNPSTSAAASISQPNTQHTIQPTHPMQVDQLVRSLVQDSLNHAQANLNALVQASVSKKLGQVYSVINKLNDTVANLSISGRNSPQNPIPQVNPTANSGVQSPPVSQETFPNINRTNTVTPPAMSVSSSQGIKIERFGINFSGRPNSLSVEDFIYRLEYFKNSYKLDWNDILGELHVLVSGPAQEWYWLQLKNGNVSSWESLKYLLLEMI